MSQHTERSDALLWLMLAVVSLLGTALVLWLRAIPIWVLVPGAVASIAFWIWYACEDWLGRLVLAGAFVLLLTLSGWWVLLVPLLLAGLWRFR